MWLATEMSSFGYLWLFALLRLGCGQDIIFEDYEETGAYMFTPQSSSMSSVPSTSVTPQYILWNQLCPAPPQPQNGEWRLREDLCEKGDADCKVPEGFGLELTNSLIYKCSSGYKIEGDHIVRCKGTGILSAIPSCKESQCPALSKKSRSARCSRSGESIDCESPVPLNTTAVVSCNPGYREAGKVPVQSDVVQQSVISCNEDGNWDPAPIRCVPVIQDCGKPKEVSDWSTGVAIGAWETEVKDFPWQATLYKEEPSPNGRVKTFICGATTIKSDFVMTAAHCVYDERTRTIEDARKLYVRVGNGLRDYDHPDNVDSQSSVVRKVYLPFDYYGLRGNYGSDISLLELQEPFILSKLVVPACLGSLIFDTPFLRKGAVGKVAGFGRTENEVSSPILLAVTAPYVPYSECQPPNMTADNDVLITRDKFCAGYTNGTAVCDGDSGGGLIFKSGDKSYVMGIVSVSLGVDFSNGERTCSKHALTVYTKVSEYIDWIQTVVSDPQQSKQSPSSMGDSQSSREDSAATIPLGTSPSVFTQPPSASEPLTERWTPDVQEGTRGKVSEFPWQASVYEEKNTPEGIEKQFQCVAIMIKANLLLTVPSCVYDWNTNTTLDPKKLFVMAGNIHPDYDYPLHDLNIVRKSRVEVLHVNCTYIGKVKHLRWSSTALLQLEQPIQFSGNLSPSLTTVEDHSEALRDLDDRNNIFIFRTARGSVVCSNETSNLMITNYNNMPWLHLNISGPSDDTT